MDVLNDSLLAKDVEMLALNIKSILYSTNDMHFFLMNTKYRTMGMLFKGGPAVGPAIVEVGSVKWLKL